MKTLAAENAVIGLPISSWFVT